MSSLSKWSIAVAFVGTIWLTPGAAFAETWNWNPFEKKASPTSSPLYANKSSSKKSTWWPEWKTPTMPWSKKNSKVNSYAKKNSSLTKKMSQTTQRWWESTKAALDPYPDPKPIDSNAKSKTTFSSWFKREEPKKVESVNDFLKQKMVD
jgi:hypothetical protein